MFHPRWAVVFRTGHNSPSPGSVIDPSKLWRRTTIVWKYASSNLWSIFRFVDIIGVRDKEIFYVREKYRPNCFAMVQGS